MPFEFYKEGCPMVTYEALFQYTLVIIGIITLIITVNKRSNPPDFPIRRVTS